MKLTRPDLAAYGLVALCLLVLTVLTVLGKGVPDVVTYLAVTALGVGGGVALQGPTAPAQEILRPTQLSSSGSTGNLPVAAYPPAPVPLTSEPATGVFRAATHAP